jgi:hypothetical protein
VATIYGGHTEGWEWKDGSGRMGVEGWQADGRPVPSIYTSDPHMQGLNDMHCIHRHSQITPSRKNVYSENP